jgi:hypothetical protein
MPPEEPTIIQGNAPAAEPAAVPAPALPVTSEVTLLTPSTPPAELPVEPVAETPAAPVEIPAASVEAPEVASEAKPAEPTKPEAPESLLEKAGKPEEPKAADKPAEPPKPAEAPVDVVKYEPFVLPEGITADEKRIAAFQEIVGPLKVDQETAQKLVDLHASTLQEFAAAARQAQIDAWHETTRGWQRNTLADEQLGGAGHQTALMASARMRDLLVPENRRQAFSQMLKDTGIGDHPEFIRIFHNAARLFDEPAAPPIPARPVPDRGGSAKPSKGAVMYDHPSSRRVAGR